MIMLLWMITGVIQMYILYFIYDRHHPEETELVLMDYVYSAVLGPLVLFIIIIYLISYKYEQIQE